MRHFEFMGAFLLLTACATGTVRQAGPIKINPASLAANPGPLDGREVEVVGLVVWESDRAALYQSYGSYCRGGDKIAISVDWPTWPAVSRADNRRMVTVRGTFHNQPGAAGPGPLQPGAVIRWLSAAKPTCPKALP